MEVWRDGWSNGWIQEDGHKWRSAFMWELFLNPRIIESFNKSFKNHLGIITFLLFTRMVARPMGQEIICVVCVHYMCSFTEHGHLRRKTQSWSAVWFTVWVLLPSFFRSTPQSSVGFHAGCDSLLSPGSGKMSRTKRLGQQRSLGVWAGAFVVQPAGHTKKRERDREKETEGNGDPGIERCRHWMWVWVLGFGVEK